MRATSGLQQNPERTCPRHRLNLSQEERQALREEQEEPRNDKPVTALAWSSQDEKDEEAPLETSRLVPEEVGDDAVPVRETQDRHGRRHQAKRLPADQLVGEPGRRVVHM